MIHINIHAFFDFAAAFPSAAHDWIFMVLRIFMAPTWFVNIVHALYSQNDTYHMTSFGVLVLHFCGCSSRVPQVSHFVYFSH